MARTVLVSGTPVITCLLSSLVKFPPGTPSALFSALKPNECLRAVRNFGTVPDHPLPRAMKTKPAIEPI